MLEQVKKAFPSAMEVIPEDTRVCFAYLPHWRGAVAVYAPTEDSPDWLCVLYDNTVRLSGAGESLEDARAALVVEVRARFEERMEALCSNK